MVLVEIASVCCKQEVLNLESDRKNQSNHTDVGRSFQVPYTRNDLPQRIQIHYICGNLCNYNYEQQNEPTQTYSRIHGLAQVEGQKQLSKRATTKYSDTDRTKE